MEWFGAVELFTQVITYFMIAAGVPTCLSMLRSKNTYGVPYPFFLAGLVNSVMSFGYGVLVDSLTFKQINAIATIFNIFYVSSYIYASKSKSQPLSQFLGSCGVMFCSYMYITRLVAPDNQQNTLGSMLLVITTILLLTPFLQVRECINDKSAAGVSIFMLLCNTLCSSAWLTYGMLLKDFFIYGPNIIGIGTSVCQWATVLIYGTAPPKGKKD